MKIFIIYGQPLPMIININSFFVNNNIKTEKKLYGTTFIHFIINLDSYLIY